jgi:glycine/D-amino acid oxidase-like deaminating enzyme
MVTKKRDLRTGRAVWQGRSRPQVETQVLACDLETEVLVVGAGITGAFVAQALAAEGMDVAVVDRRGPACGSTAASTALVQYEIDVPLTMLSARIGLDRARRAWRRSRLAVDALAGVLRSVGCADMVQRDTLYLAGNVLDPEALRQESAARRAVGLETSFLGQAQLRSRFGIRARGALMTYGNLAIDPRKATLSLLADAVANRARIFAPADIVGVEARQRHVTARTKTGEAIKARHLVFATGYEMPKAVPGRGHKIISTWAFATRPQRSRLWPGEVMIWEAADPYLYIRTTSDGRVICGGEDEEFSDAERRDALIERKTRTLERKLARVLPGIDARADLAWAGSFGNSSTGLPTIGKVPGMPNCWAALGYGGNGTTYSRIAAEIIRGALCGRPDADADLYDFRSRA